MKGQGILLACLFSVAREDIELLPFTTSLEYNKKKYFFTFFL
jgi:hypothetical protein